MGAKRQMYEQKDRIKGFRSQQLLADVLSEQKLQMREKIEKAEYEVQRNQYFHRKTMEAVHQGDQKEAEKHSNRKLKAKQFAKMQLEQLKDYTQRHIDSLVQERIEGHLILENAKHGIAEEEKKAQERRRQARQNNIEMERANDRLKKVKLQETAVQQKEEKKIEEYAKQRDQITGKRKAHKKSKQEEKQRQVQEMIDRAVSHLSAMKNHEDVRLEKEVTLKKQAEEAKLNAKAEYRRKHWEAIDRSRQDQIDMRVKTKKDVKKRDIDMKDKWAAKRQALVEQENKEKLELRRRNKELSGFVISQREEKRAREKKAKQDTLSKAYKEAARIQAEEADFDKFLSEKIDEAAAQGKNIETMTRSLKPRNEIKGFVFY